MEFILRTQIGKAVAAILIAAYTCFLATTKQSAPGQRIGTFSLTV